MITRTLGKILRGTATPFQLFTACLLAAVLGFMPGWGQAPGLIVLTTLLLIILNANLALAGLVAVLAKLLSLALAPVSFAVGRYCLDGPPQPFFQSMINAPLLALFGFDYYLTTGGLVLGLALGTMAGLAVVILLNTFRRKMSVLETGSEKFQQFTSKGWVKVMTFIFVGGAQKKFTYEELLARRVGNPIRPLGLVFVGLVVVLVILVQMFAAGPIVQMVLQEGLEKANGATVDLAHADLNLKENRLVLTGLALADPNALETDLFRAVRLEADLSGFNLLRKRMQIDRIIINEASHGEKRAQRGRLVGPPPQPTSPAPTEPGAKSIDDYLREAKQWKERLAQVKRWLDKLSGPEGDRPAATDPQTGKPKAETLAERLAREVKEKGYAQVRASHLIEGAPTLTITELVAHKVRVAGLDNQTLDITATNLSTHPKLLGKTPQVIVRSSTDTLGLDLLLAEFDPAPAQNRLEFFYRGLETDRVASQLKVGDKPPVKGGTIDLQTKGLWSSAGGVQVDLPIQAVLHNTTFTLPNTPPTPVETFTLPISLRGPLDNPRIRIDDQQLTSALAQAGVAKAKAVLTDKAKEALNQKAGDKLGDASKGLLDGVLGPKPEKKP